jgi:hypothetical protein
MTLALIVGVVWAALGAILLRETKGSPGTLRTRAWIGLAGGLMLLIIWVYRLFVPR